jgi:TetR/AcrR family transcriptional regulator, transcriptional repressor for nem operon
MATRARSAHVKASQPKSAKRDLLLQAAQRLMLRRGYWATSLDEICEASGLSKGVFFHYFASKKDLGEQTLRYFFDDIETRLHGNAGALPSDPLERVRLLIQGMAQILSSPDGPGGCLIATFTIDTAEADSELRERCAGYFDEWARILQQHLQAAIDQYAPHAPLDSAELAYYCISVIEGSLLLIRARRSGALLAQNLDLLMKQLQFVLLQPLPTVKTPARSKRKIRRMSSIVPSQP